MGTRGRRPDPPDLGRHRQLQVVRRTGRVPGVARAAGRPPTWRSSSSTMRVRTVELTRIQASHPSFIAAPTPENRGFSAGVNAGARLATGRHLLILNPDTQVMPGAIEAMVGYLDAHPDTAVVGARVENPGGTVQRSARRFPTMLTGLVGRSSLFTRLWPGNPLSRRDVLADARTTDADRGGLGRRFVHGGESRGVRAGRRDGRAILPVLGGRRSLQALARGRLADRLPAVRGGHPRRRAGAAATRGRCRCAPSTAARISTSPGTAPDGSARSPCPSPGRCSTPGCWRSSPCSSSRGATGRTGRRSTCDRRAVAIRQPGILLRCGGTLPAGAALHFFEDARETQQRHLGFFTPRTCRLDGGCRKPVGGQDHRFRTVLEERAEFADPADDGDAADASPPLVRIVVEERRPDGRRSAGCSPVRGRASRRRRPPRRRRPAASPGGTSPLDAGSRRNARREPTSSAANRRPSMMQHAARHALEPVQVRERQDGHRRPEADAPEQRARTSLVPKYRQMPP